ncbi:MAG: hypothetical protein H7Z38_22965, partial [Rubrivivax sp.]|nr:hypothetical protein [Pyrinomonadaceae bacterium]
MSAKASTTARSLAWLMCLAAIFVCAVGAWAQQMERAWAWQNPLPQGNAIYAVRFAPDKLTGWAVGADGVILRTKDGGFRWQEQHAATPVALYGLFVRDAKRAVAVGARGQVLTTDNGGSRWVLRQTGVKDHLFSVAFAADALRGWAVGSYGQIVKTADGGRTWTAQKSGVRAHLFSVSFADAGVGAAVGDAGALVTTRDGGATWTDRSVTPGLPFPSVAFARGSRKAVAVGLGGTI